MKQYKLGKVIFHKYDEHTYRAENQDGSPYPLWISKNMLLKMEAVLIESEFEELPKIKVTSGDNNGPTVFDALTASIENRKAINKIIKILTKNN